MPLADDAQQTRTLPPFTPYDRNCPSRRLLDRIGDRWAVLVVGALAEGPRRFNEIAHLVDGVSQKMLSQTLRGLEQDGLVERTYYRQVPPRVDYALTPLGESLLGPIRGLQGWVTDNIAEVLEAQRRHDAKSSAPAGADR